MAESEVQRFTAVEWWELKGRGWVADIAGIPGFDPLSLSGQQVEIDGERYTVKGVEWDLVRSTGRAFGLLVGDAPQPR